MTRIQTNSNKEIYAFIREKEGNKVVLILNLTSQPQNVDLHDHAISGTFTNAFTGEIVRFEDTSILALKPWEYLIFSNKIN
jgi:hypothetical protein